MTAETNAKANDQIFKKPEDPSIAVQGNVKVTENGEGTEGVKDCVRCTAVYRSQVAGMRAWVGEEFADTCAADKGYIMFAPAGHPQSHPHDHQQLLYPYGEFCTEDPKLIACLDALLACGKVFGVSRVKDPIPVKA